MKNSLENLEIKNPCQMDWEEMMGNEKVRRCERCQQSIYNISELTRRRALKVLNQPNEKICISYLQDENKQIITQTYFGIFKRNLVRAGGAILALIFSFSSIYAVQIRNPKLKKKKTLKHRKHKKQVTPPKLLVGRPAPKTKRLVGLQQ